MQDADTFVGTPPAARPADGVVPGEAAVRDLFVEADCPDDGFVAAIRHEHRRREARLRRGREMDDVLRGLGIAGLPGAGETDDVVVEGDPQGVTLGELPDSSDSEPGGWGEIGSDDEDLEDMFGDFESD